MAMILDTDLVPPKDRIDAVGQAIQLSGIPARITHEPPPEHIFARIKLSQLGGGTTLMHRNGSGLRLTRTPHQLRAAAPERISLTVLGPGRWTYTQGRQDRQVQSQLPGILLTNQAAPYEFNRIGRGQTYAVGVDHAALGLPIDRVQAASERIEASPVYPLVRNHVLQLSSDLDSIPAGPALGIIENAVTELIRALIISATEDPERQHAAITDSLTLRIALYIDDHLHEPDLTPSRIARDHHISLRQLYNVWVQGQRRDARAVDHQQAARDGPSRPGSPECSSAHDRGDRSPFRFRRYRAFRQEIQAGVWDVAPGVAHSRSSQRVGPGPALS